MRNPSGYTGEEGWGLREVSPSPREQDVSKPVMPWGWDRKASVKVSVKFKKKLYIYINNWRLFSSLCLFSLEFWFLQDSGCSNYFLKPYPVFKSYYLFMVIYCVDKSLIFYDLKMKIRVGKTFLTSVLNLFFIYFTVIIKVFKGLLFSIFIVYSVWFQKHDFFKYIMYFDHITPPPPILLLFEELLAVFSIILTS